MDDYADMTDREIDALVAERVMGWADIVLREGPPVPRYTTDFQAFGILLNMLQEKGWYVHCVNCLDGSAIVTLSRYSKLGDGTLRGDPDVTSHNGNLCRALAIAALRAPERAVE